MRTGIYSPPGTPTILGTAVFLAFADGTDENSKCFEVRKEVAPRTGIIADEQPVILRTGIYSRPGTPTILGTGAFKAFADGTDENSKCS